MGVYQYENGKFKEISVSGTGGGGTGGISAADNPGIEPSNMRFFIAYPSDGGVKLRFLEPDDTIIDGQTLCTWKGTKVIVKEGSYPEDENDGIEILNCTERGKYEKDLFSYDGLDNGKEYYVQAFPYSDHFVYNRNYKNARKIIPNIVSTVSIMYTAKDAAGCEIVAKLEDNVRKAYFGEDCIATLEIDIPGVWDIGGQKVNIEVLGQVFSFEEKMYGYDWKTTEPDTETCITYPDTVDNTNFEPVPAREKSEEIKLKDWQEFHDWLGVRPVMLSENGEVAYEFDHNDQSYRIDGEPSDISDTTKNGNAMVEFPKRYFKRWSTGTEEYEIQYAHFRVSRFKLGEDWKCFPWMYGIKEEYAYENDNIYLPMFAAGNIGNKLRTLAGYYPTTSMALTTATTFAHNVGNGYEIDDFQNKCMIMDYMLMMGKSTDIQKHWGQGRSTGLSKNMWEQNAVTNIRNFVGLTGSLKNKGPYYGGIISEKIKFMWMEDFYASIWRHMQGIVYISNKVFVKNFPPYIYDATEIQKDGSGWKGLGITIIGTSGGYVSKVSYDENGLIPIETKGSATTFLPDLFYFSSQTAPSSLFGNISPNGQGCGFSLNLTNSNTSAGYNVSATVSYKKPHPLPE